jgi:hypothetical protein
MIVRPAPPRIHVTREPRAGCCYAPKPYIFPHRHASAAELLPALDASLDQARRVLRSLDDAAMGSLWRLVDGDREMTALPVWALLRSLMLNHWYHPRTPSRCCRRSRRLRSEGGPGRQLPT